MGIVTKLNSCVGWFITIINSILKLAQILTAFNESMRMVDSLSKQLWNHFNFNKNSMGLKHSVSENRFQPGPGAYNHKSSVLE